MATITRELLYRRSAREKHFETDIENEYVAQVYSHDVHYRDVSDSGWFERGELWENVSGGRMWKSKDFEYGVANGSITITYKGRSMTMRPSFVGMVDSTAPGTRNRKMADADYSNVSWNGRTATVSDIFPNTDLVVRFSDKGFSKEFVIRQRPNLPDPSSLGWDASKTYLVFAWDVTKPSGAVVRDSVTGSVVSNGYVGKNDLLVQNAQGDTIFTFPAGTAESSNPIRSKRSGPVWYVSLGAQVPFGEAIPYSRAMIATYPLTVDPTTTIYGTASDDGTIIYDYYGTHYVEAGATALRVQSAWGSEWYDDGKGSSGWYNWDYGCQAYLRFDLSSLSGRSCTAASFSIVGAGSTGANRTNSVIILDSDFGTLDTGDLSATGTDIGSIMEADVSVSRSISIPAATAESRFGGYLALRIVGDMNDGGVNYWCAQESGYADPYLSITYVSTCEWVEPPMTGANETDTTPTLNFSTAVSATDAHINIQLDTADTFNSGSLRDIRTDVSVTGFEYWDGAAWQAVPSTGIPAAKAGNPGRYTPSTLPYGTWYRRIRQR